MQSFLFEDPRPDIQELLNRLGESDFVFLKFLAENDLGLTGSHQDGIYITRDCWPMFLSEEGKAGENLDKEVQLRRMEGPPIRANFKWYGKTKSEYRLTRLKELFRGSEERFLGALFILTLHRDQYRVNILTHEEDTDTVLNFFGITPADVGGILKFDLDEKLASRFQEYRDSLRESNALPSTDDISQEAQRIFEDKYKVRGQDLDPDRDILRLINLEYALFRFLEKAVYGRLLDKRMESLDELLSVSLEIINRRKSRAGRSLENHLKYIFKNLNVPFAFDQMTENRKRPDFIFPGIEQYRNPSYDARRLFCLGAKTTCKDRWRQVVTEADRITVKHLFTLQRGFTTAQLHEMQDANIVPVIPVDYQKECKKHDRELLMSLREFIELVSARVEAELTLF